MCLCAENVNMNYFIDEPHNLLSPNCSSYSNLSLCTEDIFDCLLVPWPNPFVEGIFVDIHTKFFKDCPTEELSDPPPAIVFALVITPICLIPVMVSLVVLKTKNGDGSSWNPPPDLCFQASRQEFFEELHCSFSIPAWRKLACLHMYTAASPSVCVLYLHASSETTDRILIQSELVQQHHLLFSNREVSFIQFAHTIQEPRLEFYCIRGYDNKTSTACKGKAKAYLYWQSSLWWAAIILRKDKVTVIADFCIVFTAI